jgi:ubiquitin-protein ligase
LHKHFQLDIGAETPNEGTIIGITPKGGLPYRFQIALPPKYPLGEPTMKLIILHENFNSVLKTDKFFAVSDFLNKSWSPSLKLVDVILK